MPFHPPVSNIEIIKCFNCQPRFNGVFPRDSLPWIKGRAYVINPDDKQSKGTHWVSLFIDRHGCALWFFWNWMYSARGLMQNQR